MSKSEPRYQPVWAFNGAEKFLGHAGELDVWTERSWDGSQRHVYLVGPKHRHLPDPEEPIDHNYDSYLAEDGALVMDHPYQEVHVELAEMCEVYALCAAHNVFEGKGTGDGEE